jgi:hypothetical protein
MSSVGMICAFLPIFPNFFNRLESSIGPLRGHVTPIFKNSFRPLKIVIFGWNFYWSLQSSWTIFPTFLKIFSNLIQFFKINFRSKHSKKRQKLQNSIKFEWIKFLNIRIKSNWFGIIHAIGQVGCMQISCKQPHVTSLVRLQFWHWTNGGLPTDRRLGGLNAPIDRNITAQFPSKIPI